MEKGSQEKNKPDTADNHGQHRSVTLGCPSPQSHPASAQPSRSKRIIVKELGKDKKHNGTPQTTATTPLPFQQASERPGGRALGRRSRSLAANNGRRGLKAQPFFQLRDDAHGKIEATAPQTILPQHFQPTLPTPTQCWRRASPLNEVHPKLPPTTSIKLFSGLAARGDGQTMSKKTFLQFFDDFAGVVGERVFDLFDRQKRGIIDFDDFISGYPPLSLLLCQTRSLCPPPRVLLILNLFSAPSQT